ncbi:TraR/DksA C4-type zinc finger protein [Desulfosarcina sp.]|uniref:TraR/DksA family transcriptional regulator n=1 Tax=Desulfosarcina sp. TaxID=2027861 RepID=UPI0029BC0928|nr:TraR/DksA C4-type zinc finger protein [Desulfosarcina sp.]MDX2451614.1 TraR/DksA C4-type zinc finger protein [Desulfosarcina sp.]MDX2489403.1 TraR/DksA C4-type zinc finger protein [Desulfosarcina sp.]
MTKDEKVQLTHHIRNRIELTGGNIAAFKAGSVPVSPDNAIGRLTRMEAINSKSINEAALRKARTTRALLEKALRTIDSEDFGLCRDCEEPIAFARLMAMPEAALCVACASRHE